MMITLTDELSTMLKTKSDETGIKPDDIINSILIESLPKFNKKSEKNDENGVKMIRVADLFSDLIDIVDYDETDVVEIRDNIRERKI